jgi:hypothetical protein
MKDAVAVLTRRVRADLKALERLHRRASRRKWYGRTIRDGQIVGPSLQPWQDYARAYANTAALLEDDPCLVFLATTRFSLPGRGNPAKIRNSTLRRALRGVGLSKRQIDAVLSGLGWVTVR